MRPVRVSGLRSATGRRMPSRFRESLPLSHARVAHSSDAWQGGATGATSAFPVRRWSERRVVVLAAAAGLFAAIFALRQTSTDGADATELLYVVPISLVALELGLLAGAEPPPSRSDWSESGRSARPPVSTG